jgi:integrase
MTGQSLFYMGESDLKHKVLAIVEEEGAMRAAYALKLLQSGGVLTIASTGKDATTGRLITHQYRVEGPVMLFLTTTAIDLDEELQNRCLVLAVDEDRAQTQAIHKKQREAQTIERGPVMACLAKKRKRGATPPEGTPLAALLAEHLTALRVRDYSEHTVRNRDMNVRYFLAWCAERGLTEPTGITWFRWMTRQNHILHNPASEIELPRLGHRLPKHVLTIQEVEQVLQQPDIHDPIGLRDRAVMEVFYSTGMRRIEAFHLKLFDLDLERGTILIRQGKGKKDRFVPIGDRAAVWVQKYIREARPKLALDPDNPEDHRPRIGGYGSKKHDD